MPTNKESITFYAPQPVSEFLDKTEISWGSKSRSALMNQILLQWILLDRLGLLDEALKKAAFTQGVTTVEELREKITTDEATQRISNSL